MTMRMVQFTCQVCAKVFDIQKNYADYHARRKAPILYCSLICVGVSKRRKRDASLFAELSIPEPMSGCWLWEGPVFNNGYGRIGCPYKAAHRLSFEVFNGPIPEGMVIRHKCDVPLCVNPEHLEYGTAADNVADKIARSRQARGKQIARAVLTDEEVLSIRAAIQAGQKKASSLARDYGVTVSAIRHVVARRSWKHI